MASTIVPKDITAEDIDRPNSLLTEGYFYHVELANSFANREAFVLYYPYICCSITEALNDGRSGTQWAEFNAGTYEFHYAAITEVGATISLRIVGSNVTFPGGGADTPFGSITVGIEDGTSEGSWHSFKYSVASGSVHSLSIYARQTTDTI